MRLIHEQNYGRNKYKIIYSGDFQWNNYNLILVKKNGVLNSTSKKPFLGCKVEKWKSGRDP